MKNLNPDQHQGDKSDPDPDVRIARFVGSAVDPDPVASALFWRIQIRFISIKCTAKLDSTYFQKISIYGNVQNIENALNFRCRYRMQTKIVAT